MFACSTSQEKLEKKATKTKIKERVIAEIQEEKTAPEDTPPLQRQVSVRDEPRPSTREQVIQNHYYYYGTPPPQPQQEQAEQQREPPKRKRRGRKKRPPTPSSSSESEYSDADEPETYKAQYKEQPVEQPVPQETKIPKFKFAFA